jgi:hypothetical protein
MPEGCVVDTDVVSYLLRGDTRAARFRPYLIDRLLAISLSRVGKQSTAFATGSPKRAWFPD